MPWPTVERGGTGALVDDASRDELATLDRSRCTRGFAARRGIRSASREGEPLAVYAYTLSVQPYAPPATPYPGPPVTPGPTGRIPLPWEITEVLSGAWNVFTRHWAPLCVGMLLVGLIVGGPIMVVYFVGMFASIAASEGAVAGSAADPDMAAAVALGLLGTVLGVMFLAMLLAPLFMARLMRMAMTAVRGGTPAIGDVFKGEMRYGSMLALAFLQGLAIMVGYMLLVVPGVILALGLYFSAFLVVDQRMGAVEAMKASWQLTSGRKGQVFVLMLVLGLVSAGCGLIPFVGHFIGYSLMWLSMAIVYLRLMGEAVPVLPALQSPYPAPAPQYGAYGGYAPPPYGPPPYGPPPR